MQIAVAPEFLIQWVMGSTQESALVTSSQVVRGLLGPWGVSGWEVLGRLRTTG